MTADPNSWIWLTTVVLHSGATWFLVGLIWMIQKVHYPSFVDVAPSRYEEFQQAHMAAMGRLIGFPWLVEGITVLGLFLLAPTTQIRLIALLGGLLEASVIGVTMLWSIPAHQALSTGYSHDAHNTLLRTNWFRTWAWTARGGIAIVVLVWTLQA